ncbi:MAG: M20 family metallopeptidase [Propionibacteriaceae bacterium]|nr:M20 family metallopeptidase [Propionibacteriaceae bacterium]
MPDYLAEAADHLADISALRHALHRWPETGDDLPRTQAAVLDALAGLDLEVTTGTDTSSVVAVLRGGAAGPDGRRPVVLLRGDMDGLPVPEETGMDFASERDGFMHACGHDLHTSTLVGAARLLHAHRAELPGDVVFMFQPGEETLTGANLMLAEGVLDAAGRAVDRAFGLHAFSGKFPPGTWTTRPGTLMAASDLVTVDIVGQGGHGSTPSLANDPVPVMAEVILGVQTIIAKKFSPFDPVIVNVGVATAGQASNVIPERCHLEMSVRTFSPEARERAEGVLTTLIEGIAAAHGCQADITYRRGVSPTVNDAAITDVVARVLGDLVGERFSIMDEPLGGSEDFSEVLARVPGCFVFYSAVPDGVDADTAPLNHSGQAWFDDAPLAEAMAVYAALAHDSLAELAG